MPRKPPTWTPKPQDEVEGNLEWLMSKHYKVSISLAVSCAKYLHLANGFRSESAFKRTVRRVYGQAWGRVTVPERQKKEGTIGEVVLPLGDGDVSDEADRTVQR
jgi:hypothetical protein